MRVANRRSRSKNQFEVLITNIIFPWRIRCQRRIRCRSRRANKILSRSSSRSKRLFLSFSLRTNNKSSGMTLRALAWPQLQWKPNSSNPQSSPTIGTKQIANRETPAAAEITAQINIPNIPCTKISSNFFMAVPFYDLI